MILHALGAVAALYVLAYLAWPRGRVDVQIICPNRDGELPREIVDRLGAPVRLELPSPSPDPIGYDSIDLGRFPEPIFLFPGEHEREAYGLYMYALERLHRDPPRMLCVDFRPTKESRGKEGDADIAMHAWELICRLRRYSRYRNAAITLAFQGPVETTGYTLRG